MWPCYQKLLVDMKVVSSTDAIVRSVEDSHICAENAHLMCVQAMAPKNAM